MTSKERPLFVRKDSYTKEIVVNLQDARNAFFGGLMIFKSLVIYSIAILISFKSTSYVCAQSDSLRPHGL